MTRIRRLLCFVLLLMVAFPTAAAAAPEPPPIPVAPDKWPEDQKSFVPGTSEFQGEYNDPRCGLGQNITSYVSDLIRYAPELFNTIRTATGRSPIVTHHDGKFVAVDTSSIPKAIDSKASFTIDGQTITVPELFGQQDVELEYRKWPCAKELSKYANLAEAHPLGFTFYNTPDAASLAHFKDKRSTLGKDKQFWEWFDNLEADHLVKVTEPATWCSSDWSPLCATAYFLHCPETSEVTAAIMDCRDFNANTIITNAKLKTRIFLTPGSGSPNAAQVWRSLFTAGYQDALTGLRRLHDGIAGFADGVVRVGQILIGAAIIVGAVKTGGLIGIILAIFGIGVAAGTFDNAFETAWAGVTCTLDLGRCLGKLFSGGLMAASKLLVGLANQEPPALTGDMKDLLRRVGGLVVVLAILFLVVSLIIAVARNRPASIFEPLIGLIEIAVFMAISGTAIGLVWQGSRYAAQIIGGATDGSVALATFGNRLIAQTVSFADPAAVGPGWLMLIVLMAVGIVAAIIVWIVMFFSTQWVWLILAVLLLQMAGRAGSETMRKWSATGWSLLWTIILLYPIITLIVTLGFAQYAGGSDIRGFAGAILMLCTAAFGPTLIVRLFPMAGAASLGIGERLMRTGLAGAGIGGWVQRRVRARTGTKGSAVTPLPSRATSLLRATSPTNNDSRGSSAAASRRAARTGWAGSARPGQRGGGREHAPTDTRSDDQGRGPTGGLLTGDHRSYAPGTTNSGIAQRRGASRPSLGSHRPSEPDPWASPVSDSGSRSDRAKPRLSRSRSASDSPASSTPTTSALSADRPVVRGGHQPAPPPGTPPSRPFPLVRRVADAHNRPPATPQRPPRRQVDIPPRGTGPDVKEDGNDDGTA